MGRVIFLILLLLVLVSVGTLGLSMVAKDRAMSCLSGDLTKAGCRLEEQTLTVEEVSNGKVSFGTGQVVNPPKDREKYQSMSQPLNQCV